MSISTVQKERKVPAFKQAYEKNMQKVTAEIDSIKKKLVEMPFNF